MDDKNDPASAAAEQRGDQDSLPATDNIDITLPLANHSLPDGDKSDHDCKDIVEIGTACMNGSLPRTEQTGDDSLPAVDENKDGVVTQGMNGSPPRKEQTGDDSLPAVDEHKDGVVILLVGNKQVDKTGVVNSLTRSGKWTGRKTAVNSSGDEVLILTRESPALVIIDTTPLRNVQGRSPVAIARRWISRNQLRRLVSGKDVVVVCVVTCRVRNTCTWDMFSYSNCWVDVFGLIFKDHKAAVMVLVNTEGKEDVQPETKEEVARFVLEHGLSPKNLTFSNLKKGDDSVSKVIEDCIRKRKNPQDRKTNWIVSYSRPVSARLDLAKDGLRPPRWKRWLQVNKQRADINYTHGTVMPCTINDAFSQKYEALGQKEKFVYYNAVADKEKFGPWGPERVILLGRTGSGKSTLAQMLTLGHLDKVNEMFDPHTGFRGGTKSVKAGIGRGWYVLDTPGFGEPECAQSTISTREVECKIKDYVRDVEGTFSHYIYVVKQGRLDILEDRLWEFFTALFGEEIKRQFTVVVSGSDASEEWIKKNIGDLKACFTGCESFLSACFPPIDEDVEVEDEFRDMRTDSLSELEQKLAALNRSDMVCKYGRLARLNIWMETVRANLDLGIEKSERIKFLVRGASLIFACCNITRRPFAELTNILRVHDRISLVPV